MEIPFHDHVTDYIITNNLKHNILRQNLNRQTCLEECRDNEDIGHFEGASEKRHFEGASEKQLWRMEN